MPAGLNNIVGLKPSLGLVSTTGVVPACRSLDCVSVFALTTDDAWTTLGVIAGPDPSDPYSRDRTIGDLATPATELKIGVPLKGQRIFFGDHASEHAFDHAIAQCAAMGAKIVETDIEALYDTARLLYEGPWVAERYLAIRSLLASSPDALHPITKSIIVPGGRLTAADTFSAFYRLEELRRVRDIIFRGIDALLLPTAPTAYTVAQVLADPVQLNSRLGTYTNFVNLLDLCGLAIPSSIRADGIPFGITLLAPGRTRRAPCLDRAHASRQQCVTIGRIERTSATVVTSAGAEMRFRHFDRGRRRAYVRDAAQWRVTGAWWKII